MQWISPHSQGARHSSCICKHLQGQDHSAGYSSTAVGSDAATLYICKTAKGHAHSAGYAAQQQDLMLQLLELLQLPLGLWRSSNSTPACQDSFDPHTACLLSDLRAGLDPVAFMDAVHHGNKARKTPLLSNQHSNLGQEGRLNTPVGF